MPSKNIVKNLYEGGYYHVYNRGVAKQNIFRRKEDYVVFLRYLKEYLLPAEHPDILDLHLQGSNPRRKTICCYSDVELQAFCLMPNHFHMLVKNLSAKGLTRFMRAISTNYAVYFNHKYARVGPLYQGNYKAAEITNEGYYIWVSRYIHRNPLDLSARVGPLQDYPYSSYQAYLGKWKADWLVIDDIVERFSKDNPRLTYKNFVEESVDLIPDLEPILIGLDD